MSTGALEAGDAAAAAVATHPRVTLDSLLAKIKDTRFYRDGTLTIAVVESTNGFKFVGHSAPASPENFNQELGQKLAQENAIRHMWSHEGYLLCEKLIFGEVKVHGKAEGH